VVISLSPRTTVGVGYVGRMGKLVRRTLDGDEVVAE